MTVLTLAGATLASGALVAVALPGAALEIWLGLAAPLAAAICTHLAIARTHRRDPARLTGVMVRLFAGKFVLFGAYIVLAMTSLPLEAAPFLLSFVAYFAVLHVVEAAHLRRLSAAGEAAPQERALQETRAVQTLHAPAEGAPAPFQERTSR